MARLTITLSDEKHRALKETAARTGKSIRLLIEESLELAGIKSLADAKALLPKARRRSALDERSALELAMREVRAHRRG
jgi:hypothetical protein